MDCETNQKLDLNWDRISSSKEPVDASSGVQPQDVDDSSVSFLGDELVVSILARVPTTEYWKFCLVNKRFCSLVRSGELFRIRRCNGLKALSVLMLVSGDSRWWSFDQQFKFCRKLPILQSDPRFASGSKESFCAGTHLVVSGREVSGHVIWRYELATNKWFKGPSMIYPRCLFASASRGVIAYIAGGIGLNPFREVLDSAEIYNSESESWYSLPRMNRRRKLCSGFYMDDKFFVIGGENDEGEYFTCGEAYDEVRNTWELIPNMLEKNMVSAFQAPTLVAVVNNELYSLEVSSNELKVYLKRTNSWKKLGPVPIRANINSGWGVLFKSLGNELLVMGTSSVSLAGHGMSIYTCCPDPDAGELLWRPHELSRIWSSHFILKCSVMEA